MELQHLHRVAEIEVEDLVRVEHVHLGEGSLLQQVVDGRALRPRAARQLDRSGRCVGAAKVAALDRMRLQLQQSLQISSVVIITDRSSDCI